MLHPIDKNLWVVERPQKFYGLEIGTRMTVAKLSDGSLFIHSPVRLTPQLKEKLQEIGSPAFIIAPNCFHHLYIGDYQTSFPDSKIYAAPHLQEKRHDLQFHDGLETGRTYPWSTEIAHLVCAGMPKVNEGAFLHKPSRTLLLTDLVFNFDASSSRSARIFARLSGIYGRLGCPWFDRFVFLRDKEAAAESFKEILSWNFDRIIMAHGKIVEQDARSKLRRALAMWVGAILEW